jgi:hypothetical protein
MIQQQTLKNTQQNTQQDNIKDSSLYDKYCKDIYGDKSCLLVGTIIKKSKDNENEHIYEVRMLDQPDQRSTITSKKYFHTLIPNLLRYKYTVIIIEEIDNNYEIMAIHLPGHLFKFLK